MVQLILGRCKKKKKQGPERTKWREQGRQHQAETRDLQVDSHQNGQNQ
jgi:hypothetical protein